MESYRYRTYRKNFISEEPLVIRGATSVQTKERLTKWFLTEVAPCYSFMMPKRNSPEYPVAVANLESIDLLELLWMLASMQETHRVPAFPNRPDVSRRTNRQYVPLTNTQMTRLNYVPSIFCVVPSRQPKARLGVVNACSTRIPVDEVIGFYMGKRFTTAKGKKLADKKGNAYIMVIETRPRDPDGYAINCRARDESTFTRFVNEARGTVEHNSCYSQDKDGYVRLLSVKDIAPGVELLAKYKC